MISAIKGRKVILYERIDTGEVDEFNAPIFDYVSTVVDNVLIEPASNDAIVNDMELYGKRMAYVLHIPKNDKHDWKDAKVVLPDPWDVVVKTYGDCMLYDADLTPLNWNKKVKVEIYE